LELVAIITAPAFSQLGQSPISVLLPSIQQLESLQTMLESGKSTSALYQGQQLILPSGTRNSSRNTSPGWMLRSLVVLLICDAPPLPPVEVQEIDFDG
jgi:hypothetical protein